MKEMEKRLCHKFFGMNIELELKKTENIRWILFEKWPTKSTTIFFYSK